MPQCWASSTANRPCTLSARITCAPTDTSPIRTPMPNPIPRRRDAAVTREAILLSARKAFAQSGYDGAGVIEIAAGAGVTAMLVNRYFGSKEALFAEVIADTMASPIILTPDNLSAQNLGRTIATALVSITEAGNKPLEGFLIMLHSATSKRAAIIGREQVEKGHQATMAAALKGAHHEERAALVIALVSGFQVMRQMLELSALAKADPQVLIDLLTPLFQQLVDG
ncbi:TetR family transcriptional regulator [Pseudomonas lurida]|nr:TetR family transcriptional regulator [Pseudomonas lurida]PRA11738.1 TetR family transcriptional regulator [Pseudomonas sp. MYb13]PRA15429.1 TetR family transcriptional regulator [Pseudomonas lurida]PRA27458.1 TetR family transcriptional regulator [Pseudomonas lurida]PRB94349.1 TetR family transcriptional regulator [Pseudomonas lurida]